MSLRPQGWRLFASVLLMTLACAPVAHAASVHTLSPAGAAVVQDRYLPPVRDTPASPRARIAGAAPRPHKRRLPTVTSTLDALARAGSITSAQRAHWRSDWFHALTVDKQLRGTRAAELHAVIATFATLAADRELTPSRLPEVFLTVERNVEWWTQGSLLSGGDRVEFPGSGIVWEYYPGQGIQLQVLGTFGRADGLFTGGQLAQMRSLVDEMIPLAAQRAGRLAWEYLFSFDGGSPPWVSAMAQGTAIEALTRAARAADTQNDPQAAGTYLGVAHQALALLLAPPPEGVAEPTSAGARLLQYSFAPQTYILNAFLQTLIGVYDFAAISRDPAAQALFKQGDAEAQAELPSYDTGAWSLYEPGQEDDLSYHQLVLGFLQTLCTKTGEAAYCTEANHFNRYLTTAPALALHTAALHAGHPGVVNFTLSKLSHVGIVIARGTTDVFLTSATFTHGGGTFSVPALTPGTYTVRLAATDVAGNFNRIIGTLRATAPPPRRQRPHH